MINKFMEHLFEQQLTKWLEETFETTQTKDFISTKDICILYNEQHSNKINLNNIKSFSISLAKCFNKLGWTIEKGKLNNIRGYFFIKLKNIINTNSTLQHVQTCIEHVQPDTLNALQKKITSLEFELSKLNKNTEHVQSPVHVGQDDPNFIWQSGFINTIIDNWLEKHVQLDSTSCTSVNLLISNFLKNNSFIIIEPDRLNIGGRFTTKIVTLSKELWQTNNVKLIKGNKRKGSSAILGIKLK